MFSFVNSWGPVWAKPRTKLLSKRRSKFASHIGMAMSGGGAAAEFYRKEEGLDDASSIDEMKAWNDVIYASLRRKTSGNEVASPAVAGVSSVIRPLYGATCDSRMPVPTARPSPDMTPAQVVETVLLSLSENASQGARMAILFASERNKIRFTTPQHFVLFVGDSELYRNLLHVEAFECDRPIFAQSGDQCTLYANVTTTSHDIARYGFQLSRDSRACWMIDEVFKA